MGSETTPLVGVLALQGAFREHARALRRLGAGVREVRLPADLDGLDALLLPGGESTTMSGLIDDYGLREPLRDFAGPMFGTCAGLILLSRGLESGGGGRQPVPLGLIDLTVARNAYGRQRESFVTPLAVEGVGNDFAASFIRAPRVAELGGGVEVLARHRGDPVLLRQGRFWGATFHPELGGDDRVHALFLSSLNLGSPNPAGG